MRTLFRHLWLPIYRRWALRHIQSERVFQWAGIKISVPPGVFHPLLFFSTPIFITFLKTISFKNKKVLDVGTGSGLLALFAASKGAKVTAIDINPLAIETVRRNAAANELELTILESDLFDKLPNQAFDFILINPPYYPKEPRNFTEHAFFAGAELEYFEKLFEQLPAYCPGGPSVQLQQQSAVWMILSEDCNLPRLNAIATRNAFQLNVVFEQKKWGERFWVVEVVEKMQSAPNYQR